MFKSQYTLEQRFLESQRIISKYPDKIPIICEKCSKQSGFYPDIDKKKYLVPCDYTFAQFMYLIRQRLRLRAEEALFLIVRDSIPPSATQMGVAYEMYKDIDGFLYIQYAKENTFG
jgi:GABA(A) receptor-associated protein